MAANLRKLPLGIQDFEDLRTTGYLYVDKTAFVYRLVTQGKPYFLGRPRRFGKSLLLSTLKAYFLGKKELFEGLAIAGLEQEWLEYPVIYLDFSIGIYTDVNSLFETLNYNLKQYEKQWDIVLGDDNPAIRFSELIRRACEKSGRKVVVLVDEYDKPLLGTMDDLNANDDIRKALKGFYGVLKANDACLRFVFLTGVTKFSKVSVFSDLNHLSDISLDENFAEICGITEKELIENFEPEIQALAERRKITCEATLAELKKRYDGYHFAPESVGIYNPFSVLHTLSKCNFGYYWFETGTPTFLVKMIRKMDLDVRKFTGDIDIPIHSLMDYRVEWTDPVPILYQSGYLTIKGYKQFIDAYVLGYP
ncbi:MAG: AAA family ATPase, partial [Tannerella sp.]|nr:AAA family ATPase [Tannerella sp.]